uniref:Uncharacterized protein n=1 Tax=Salarias fasciatus TaxID=181472 RepID=A0A672I1J8_SALFA
SLSQTSHSLFPGLVNGFKQKDFITAMGMDTLRSRGVNNVLDAEIGFVVYTEKSLIQMLKQH